MRLKETFFLRGTVLLEWTVLLKETFPLEGTVLLKGTFLLEGTTKSKDNSRGAQSKTVKTKHHQHKEGILILNGVQAGEVPLQGVAPPLEIAQMGRMRGV